MSLRNERVRKALMREISDIIFREIKKRDDVYFLIRV
mgnify:CR=1 FL=1